MRELDVALLRPLLVHIGPLEPMPQAFREYLHARLSQAALFASLGLGFVALTAAFLWELATDPVLLGLPKDSVASTVAALALASTIAALGVAMMWSAWTSLQDVRSRVVVVRDVEVLRIIGPVRGGQFLSFRDANGTEASVKIPANWRIGVLPRRAALWTTSHSGTPLQLELDGLRYSVSSGASAG